MGQLADSSPERFDYASGICSGGCTDIDMLWERHGNVLIIENKRVGEAIPLGQEIALRALSLKPGFTVWVVVGAPPDEIVSGGRLGGEQYPCDLAELRGRIQEWWDAH